MSIDNISTTEYAMYTIKLRLKAKFEKVFRHALSYFSNEPLKSIDTGFELELILSPNVHVQNGLKKYHKLNALTPVEILVTREYVLNG